MWSCRGVNLGALGSQAQAAAAAAAAAEPFARSAATRAKAGFADPAWHLKRNTTGRGAGRRGRRPRAWKGRIFLATGSQATASPSSTSDCTSGASSPGMRALMSGYLDVMFSELLRGGQCGDEGGGARQVRQAA